jgi:glycosidase
MAAYVATIFPHGGALVYGSQEVGYPDPINFFKYVPVDWTANAGLYQEYQHLIGLYNKYPALRKGEMTAYPNKDIMLFQKQDSEDRFLIAVNVRNEEKSMELPSSWAGQKVTNLYGNAEETLGETLTLKPFEYKILK